MATDSSCSGWFELRRLIRDLRPIDYLQTFIRRYKGQNSTGTRCRGFLVLESRCRGFLVLESRCRGFLSSEKMPWNHDVVAYLSPFLDVVVFWSWNLDVVAFWSWNLDVVVFWSWNLDVVAFCPLKKRLGITMSWLICLRFSMSWLFGLGISMSWYMCLHGLVFVIIVKTKKIYATSICIKYA